MGHWRRCPECGETNYFEKSNAQYFDCGFAGRNYENVRIERCGRSGKSKAKVAGPDHDPVAGFRLALLDAARVAETIAMDMERDGRGGDYADRCRRLAEQMRAFAGHGQDADPADFDGLSGKSGRTGARLARFVRRFRVW